MEAGWPCPTLQISLAGLIATQAPYSVSWCTSKGAGHRPRQGARMAPFRTGGDIAVPGSSLGRSARRQVQQPGATFLRPSKGSQAQGRSTPGWPILAGGVQAYQWIRGMESGSLFAQAFYFANQETRSCCAKEAPSQPPCDKEDSLLTPLGHDNPRAGISMPQARFPSSRRSPCQSGSSYQSRAF